MLTQIRIEAETNRRLIRSDLAAWCRHALAPLGQAPASPHFLLIRELTRIARGDGDRLIVCMPPGHAKSTYASVLFVPWFLAQRPRLDIIAASNTAENAVRFGRRAQSLAAEHADILGYGIARERADDWETTNGGTYRCVGMGGTITSRRADLAIIDDPIKGAEEADSPTLRDRHWEWFSADLTTRLKPGGRVILILTRWHEDDLAGRLLHDQPDEWRTVVLPALAGVDDPLGRLPGAPLWPEAFPLDLLERRRALGERWFEALYQQRPSMLEGGLFKIAGLRDLVDPPPEGSTVRAWDLAGTEVGGARDPDWTVGVKLRRTGDRFTVLDVTRFRGGPDEVIRRIINTAKNDGFGCMIGIPQDPGQAGKMQVQFLGQRLIGYTVLSSPETGSKEIRAMPVASQVNLGNVRLAHGDWNQRAFIEELASFPTGVKDDQVDALSRAFEVLMPNAGGLLLAAAGF